MNMIGSDDESFQKQSPGWHTQLLCKGSEDWIGWMDNCKLTIKWKEKIDRQE